MTVQRALFDVDGRLRELPAKVDDLDRLRALVDFEIFRGDQEFAVLLSDRAKGSSGVESWITGGCSFPAVNRVPARYWRRSCRISK